MELNSVLENIYDPKNHNLIELYNNDVNNINLSNKYFKDYIKKYNGYYISDDIIDNLISLLEKDEIISEVYLRIISMHDKTKLLDVVKALKNNKTLEILDFSYNTKISDVIHDLLLLLKTDIYLRFLYLANTEMNFGHIELLSVALMFNTNLVHLNISNNKIKDKGLECILNGLKNNNTLMVLDISYNDITKTGIQKLKEVFKYNTSITSLDISINIIGIEGLNILVDLFKYNTTIVNLKLINCWIYSHPYFHIEDENSNEFLNSQSYKLIESYTLRNKILYDNTYWKPYLSNSLPPQLKKQILAFMLCNNVNKNNNVVLPFNICINIFTFFQRKDYY